MTDEEIKAAAEYFASMPWTPWIRVVETTTVPRLASPPVYSSRSTATKLNRSASASWKFRKAAKPPETYATRVGLRRLRAAGQPQKGEALVMSGGGKTLACGACHGADLKGLGPVPGIAGRSPSYLVRQMYDMQAGARKGQWTPLMTKVVSQLSEDDMIQIAAYTASLKPRLRRFAPFVPSGGRSSHFFSLPPRHAPQSPHETSNAFPYACRRRNGAGALSGQGDRPLRLSMILIPGLSSSGETWSTTVARYKDRFECHVLTVAGFAGVPRVAAPMLDKVGDGLAKYPRTEARSPGDRRAQPRRIPRSRSGREISGPALLASSSSIRTRSSPASPIPKRLLPAPENPLTRCVRAWARRRRICTNAMSNPV